MAKASSAAVQKKDSSKAVAVQASPIEEAVNNLPAGYLGASDSLAVALAGAEIDKQVSTAKKYPRNVTKAVENITALALLDEQTAEECIYALPRGNTPIKGPSIRLAEIIANQWGNNSAGSRPLIINRTEKYVEAEGVFHDLETNTRTTARTRRPIQDKLGRIYNDDMINMTANAAAAIAKRNAILAGVPKAVWRTAYGAVEAHLTSGVKTIVERRVGAIKKFHTFGVTPEEICALLKIQSVDEITADHITTLIGYYNAIKDGSTKVESLFPKKGAQPKRDEDKAPAGEGESTKESQAADAGADTETGELPAETTAEETKALSPYAKGRQARREGKAYFAIPPEFEKGSADAQAWQDGWSFEDEEIAAQKKGGKP